MLHEYGTKDWADMTEEEREDERNFALECAIADMDTPYGNPCDDDPELLASLQEKFSKENYER